MQVSQGGSPGTDSTGRKLSELASVQAVTKSDLEVLVAQPQQDWREVLTVQTGAGLAVHGSARAVPSGCARHLLAGALLTVFPLPCCSFHL